MSAVGGFENSDQIEEYIKKNVKTTGPNLYTIGSENRQLDENALVKRITDLSEPYLMNEAKAYIRIKALVRQKIRKLKQIPEEQFEIQSIFKEINDSKPKYILDFKNYNEIQYVQQNAEMVKPPAEWTPIYQLNFIDTKTNKAGENYKEFKKMWTAYFGDQSKMKFDDKNFTIQCGYSERELTALAENSHYHNLSIYFNKRVYDPSMRCYHNRGLGMTGDPLTPGPALLSEDVKVFFTHVLTKKVDFFKFDLSTDEKLISSMLSQADGIIIGEAHHERAPKEFIMQNIKQLAKEGVKTLFLEHLFYDTMQDQLDEYFQSPQDKLPPILEAYLDYLDNGFGIQRRIGEDQDALLPGFKELVIAAKEAGIRIVALDTTASYQSGMTLYGAEGSERMEAMNYTAYEIMQKEKGSGKFIAFVGSAHTSTHLGVPGLREIMDCPSLIVDELPKKSKESRKVVPHVSDHFKDIDKGGGIQSVDVLLSRKIS